MTENDTEFISTLKAQYLNLSTLAAADKASLQELSENADQVKDNLDALRYELNQTNLKVAQLTQIIHETYDTQVKKNQALDLLIKKLTQ